MAEIRRGCRTTEIDGELDVYRGDTRADGGRALRGVARR
jgi:hypothetical protein